MRIDRFWLGVALTLGATLVGCSGSDGAAGAAGPAGATGATGAPGASGAKGDQGDPGADGAKGDKGDPGADGAKGDQGDPGADGPKGADGLEGIACWDLDGNRACDVATEDKNADGVCDAHDCKGDKGDPGEPGAGYLEREPAGLVGVVRDTAGAPVVGATIYLVPAADIPTDPIALTDLAAEKNSKVDEPLEDTIAAKGAGYTKAVTDASGVYRMPTVAKGTYFLVAMPDAADDAHLPGGNHCRMAMPDAELVGAQFDVKVSTKPSKGATFVGNTVCYTCHGMSHVKQTLHALGLRQASKVGPLQNGSRFPEWDKPLKTKFTLQGTTIYYYGFANSDWKLSEKDPGAGVSFKARMYSDANGKYFVELTNVATPADPPRVFEVSLSYGGGLYKQRFTTVINGSQYVLPIQFNYQSNAVEATSPQGRWTWTQYNTANWYDEATKKLKVPALSKSFDSNCMGCHAAGFSLTGDANTGWKAHGVPDLGGEVDFDGDGQKEMLNLGCENCHGPGSDHFASAGQGKAIVSPGLLTPEREVTICAACHTRALGVGGGVTEAPLDANGRMPLAGISRNEFLTKHISKLDDGMWDATSGDGKHAKKHHQQVSDFIKSGKYRNSNMLVTCADCHDPHGKEPVKHQLREPLDDTKNGDGLCLSCHGATFPAGADVGERMQKHYASKGVVNVAMWDDQNPMHCSDCHMPKTAKSGSGFMGVTAAGVTYWSNDISSHLFDVPLRKNIATKSPEMMPIAYTSPCGTCHVKAP